MTTLHPHKLCLALTTIATLGFTTSLPASAVELFRSIDGSGNNITNPTYGQAGTQLLRLVSPAYDDGIAALRNTATDGQPLPNPRAISNAVVSQGNNSILNSNNASDWIWQWGQIIDHDLDFTEPPASAPAANILVPNNDPVFAPGSQIPFKRNVAAPGTGTDPSNPRQQINDLTAYIDGSQVYGSDATLANFLRANDGSGKLKSQITSVGELMPFNDPNNPQRDNNPFGLPIGSLFIAGDARSNEQVGLTAIHTLLLREHNRLADQIGADSTTNQKAADAGLSRDEYIYQQARALVGAEMQAITYNEFLPVLLGPNALTPYTGYNPNVNAGVSNEFANAAFRIGHTLLSPQIQRINNDGTSPGAISLRDSFFQPDQITTNGIDSLLLGLASQKAQEVDNMIVDDVRNFLFPAGTGGLDLAAVNIERGRDHGLPSYNAVREALGLGRANSFLDISSNPTTAARLASIYNSVDDVDLWVGGISEDHVNGGLVGSLFSTIFTDQFTRARDGDRFFYLNAPNTNSYLASLLPEIQNTRLSDIIRRNSSITNIQDNVFLVKSTPEPSAIVPLLALGALAASSRLLRKK